MRNNICFVYLLLLIVLPVCSKNVSHFSIYEIMCEQQVEPLGIEISLRVLVGRLYHSNVLIVNLLIVYW